MMSVAAIVTIMHIMFIVWVCTVPFVGDLHQLLLYAMVIPFVVAHWLLNNDQCALTLLEQWLRGVPSDQSFIHKIVSPIYLFMSGSDVSDAAIKQCVYILTACLWSYAVFRVWRARRTWMSHEK